MGLTLCWDLGWLGLGAVLAVSDPGEALPGTAFALPVGRGWQLSGSEESGWMSDQSHLVQEIATLRRDLAELTHRVLVLESQQFAAVAPGSPVTVNYSFPVSAAPYPEPGTPPRTTSASEGAAGPISLQSSPVRPRTLVAEYSDEERKKAAVAVGQFFSRCLSGQHRGSSEKVNLPSRVYILCRDINGQVYNPVRLFHNFTSLKPFVKPHGFCGDSVLWEAKLAVGAAGLEWPPEPALPRHGGGA